MNLTTPAIPADVLENIHSPSLVVFQEQVSGNIDRMLTVAKAAHRLRPHCKTHKMPDVIRLLLDRGITRHKAATVAEVEMLATAGVRDVVLAYNVVGPNIRRVAELLTTYPDLNLAVTADHPTPLQQLSQYLAEQNLQLRVLLDVDVGQHRTGIEPESVQALSLCRQMRDLPSLSFGGLHVYDGHQHQDNLDERKEAVLKQWPRVVELQRRCLAEDLRVDEILCGGTPTYPIYAELADPAITLSPGTSVFHDAGYGGHFPDLGFTPAAVVVTRVVSRPTLNRVTLDLGNKSVAADPPAGRRVLFPDLPNAQQVIHNEEHLVLETEEAARFQPGDVLLGIPAHICPTSALHQSATMIDENGAATEWPVTARDRKITI